MHRVLIVEDDASLAEGVGLAIGSESVRVLQCRDIGCARQALNHNAIDLVLLDINLPDGSGLVFLKEIRETAPVPVILLTANDTELDVVTGLERGAADYITKPFSLAILRARVNAQLRRREEIQTPVFTIGSYVFDFDKITFSHHGANIELSKTEQKLLRLLVENLGQIMTREVLLDRVWGQGLEFVDENTLSVAVKRLRDKLEAADYIKTVYGVGYLWKAEK